jgi:hypothetical protein
MSGRTTGEPRTAGFVTWLVLGASFGLSASTWIALAALAGFDPRLAPLMPVAVDGYVVVALLLWMAPVPAKVASFAKVNTYAAAGIGVAAQSAFHGLTQWTVTGVLWRAGMAAIVGALPPAVAALSVHMRSLVRRESAKRSSVVEREPSTPPTSPVLPLLGPVPAQVSAPAPLAVLPSPLPEPEPTPTPEVQPPAPAKKAPRASTPKRPFALTQQAAASMEAGGMDVPAIALALGISERQVRAALRPVKIDAPGAG